MRPRLPGADCRPDLVRYSRGVVRDGGRHGPNIEASSSSVHGRGRHLGVETARVGGARSPPFRLFIPLRSFPAPTRPFGSADLRKRRRTNERECVRACVGGGCSWSYRCKGGGSHTPREVSESRSSAFPLVFYPWMYHEASLSMRNFLYVTVCLCTCTFRPGRPGGETVVRGGRRIPVAFPTRSLAVKNRA